MGAVDYETWWAMVFGAHRSAEDVVRDFDVQLQARRQLAEWVHACADVAGVDAVELAERAIDEIADATGVK